MTTRCQHEACNALTTLITHLLLLYFQSHEKMSALVDYEDSDDDSLDQIEERASAVHAVSSEQNREVVSCEDSEAAPSPTGFTPERTALEYHGNTLDRTSPSLHPHPQPQSCTDWERQYCGSGDTAAPLSSPEAQGRMAPRQALPCIPQSSSEASNPAKRQLTAPPGVRPYIPKRQRLAASVQTVDPEHTAEQVEQGNQTRESHILSNVSARLKPYLTENPSAAGIPRRPLMSLGGHQGPVNTVQWCPVPHLSHLLLSASMDKTFKVITATDRLLLSPEVMSSIT
uniref:WD repeat domain 25 n=1 Tax=Stegastes partitus TaxID=144197 RepID=A0A3B5BA32_9TELE